MMRCKVTAIELTENGIHLLKFHTKQKQETDKKIKGRWIDRLIMPLILSNLNRMGEIISNINGIYQQCDSREGESTPSSPSFSFSLSSIALLSKSVNILHFVSFILANELPRANVV